MEHAALNLSTQVPYKGKTHAKLRRMEDFPFIPAMCYPSRYANLESLGFFHSKRDDRPNASFQL
ncbi:hypothetical protein N7488_000421 [Penicillium malachiteum]|nr:hypothetical protein N7488_000421 [Penicillium malachiteum]